MYQLSKESKLQYRVLSQCPVTNLHEHLTFHVLDHLEDLLDAFVAMETHFSAPPPKAEIISPN